MVLRTLSFHAAAVLSAGLLLSGCSSDSGDAVDDPGAGPTTSAASDPAEPTSSPSSTRAPYVTARVSTGYKPCGILGAAGRLWVSNLGDSTLVSIDPDTLKVSKPIPVGDKPCGLAYGAGSIWTENFASFDVTRVNARTGKVEATYDVGYSPYDVTFAAGAAWVSNYGDGTVSRIDAATGRVSKVRVGGQPTGIAAVAGVVWVGLGEAGVAGIDAATSEVLHRIPTEGVASWTAFDDEHVWVDVDSSVVEIDSATGTVVATVAVGPAPADGSLVDGTLWVGDNDGQLYRVRDGQSVPPVASGVQNPFVLVGYRGFVWAVDFVGTEVVRIDPEQVD